MSKPSRLPVLLAPMPTSARIPFLDDPHNKSFVSHVFLSLHQFVRNVRMRKYAAADESPPGAWAGLQLLYGVGALLIAALSRRELGRTEQLGELEVRRRTDGLDGWATQLGFFELVLVSCLRFRKEVGNCRA